MSATPATEVRYGFIVGPGPVFSTITLLPGDDTLALTQTVCSPTPDRSTHVDLVRREWVTAAGEPLMVDLWCDDEALLADDAQFNVLASVTFVEQPDRHIYGTVCVLQSDFEGNTLGFTFRQSLDVAAELMKHLGLQTCFEHKLPVAGLLA